jgi:hypothetical protein
MSYKEYTGKADESFTNWTLWHQALLFHVNPPRALNPLPSEAFEAVILKAVEHEAVDRFATAEDMKAVLLTCL